MKRPSLLASAVFCCGLATLGACGSDSSPGDGAVAVSDGPPATAADGGAPPGGSDTGAAGPADTGMPPATTGDRFIIDGVASKLSGKATITDFRPLKLIVAFGLAAGTIPQDYVMAVDIEYKEVVPAGTLNTGAWTTDIVNKATATLNMPATSPIGMAVWTPGTTGITFTLNVNAKKVSVTWKGPVMMGGKTYNVEAVMTDVMVPF